MSTSHLEIFCNAVSNLVGLGWCPRFCMSNKFLSDAATAVSGATLDIVLKADWMPGPTVRKHCTFFKAAPKSFNQMQMLVIKSHHLKHCLIITR